VMKASHHGAATSTSADFLRTLNPTLVIASCGTQSQYGHPSGRFLQNFSDSGENRRLFLTANPFYYPQRPDDGGKKNRLRHATCQVPGLPQQGQTEEEESACVNIIITVTQEQAARYSSEPHAPKVPPWDDSSFTVHFGGEMSHWK
jgi:hypothetical protein